MKVASKTPEIVSVEQRGPATLYFVEGRSAPLYVVTRYPGRRLVCTCPADAEFHAPRCRHREAVIDLIVTELRGRD